MHVLALKGALVNNSGNSLHDVRMYVPAWYGVPVNYSGNHLRDEHIFGNNCKVSPNF